MPFIWPIGLFYSAWYWGGVDIFGRTKEERESRASIHTHPQTSLEMLEIGDLQVKL